jgi:hypothetical protein
MNNDLIKEFARQAGFKVNWQHEDVQAIKMAQYKEFAELIVRECADVCQQFGNGGSGYTLSSEIREHFGVEE